MKYKNHLIYSFILFSICCLASVSFSQEKKEVTAKRKGTKFHIEWQFMNFPFQVEMYNLKNPNETRVGAMGKFKSRQNSIIANKINGDTIFVSDRDAHRFALVIENTSNETVFFNVVPHEITPPEFSLGTKFLCLCFGHIYSIRLLS